MSAKCCGRCEHFTLVDAPRTAEGEDRCTIYGLTNPEPLVRWDHAPTVLFWPVKDGIASDKREAWIRKVKEAANAAPAASAGPPQLRNDHLATSPHPTQNKQRHALEIESDT